MLVSILQKVNRASRPLGLLFFKGIQLVRRSLWMTHTFNLQASRCKLAFRKYFESVNKLSIYLSFQVCAPVLFLYAGYKCPTLRHPHVGPGVCDGNQLD